MPLLPAVVFTLAQARLTLPPSWHELSSSAKAVDPRCAGYYCLVDDTGRFLYSTEVPGLTPVLRRTEFKTGLSQELVVYGQRFGPPPPRNSASPSDQERARIPFLEEYMVRLAGDKPPVWAHNTPKRRVMVYDGPPGFISFAHGDTLGLVISGISHETHETSQAHVVLLDRWMGGRFVAKVGGPFVVAWRKSKRPKAWYAFTHTYAKAGFFGLITDQKAITFSDAHGAVTLHVPLRFRNYSLEWSRPVVSRRRFVLVKPNVRGKDADICIVDFNRLPESYEELPTCVGVGRGVETPVPLADGSVLLPYRPDESQRDEHGETIYLNYLTGEWGTDNPNPHLTYIWRPKQKAWDAYRDLLVYGVSNDGRFVAYSVGDHTALRLARIE